MKSKKWTIDRIPDLTGKIIVVTGGNSGLGFESAKTFANKGAETIIACRTISKGKTAGEKITSINPKATVKVMELDLTDLNSVKNFVSVFKKDHKKLDVLLNNAGIMTTPYSLTKDGFENQFGTNHLGHFALTGLLMDIISGTPGSRIVNVSSMAHLGGKMDFGNLQFENGKGYTPMKSYGRSKLANLLFTYELQRYFEKNRINSISVAAHPGVASTNLAHHIEHKLLHKIIRPVADMVIKSPESGALPQIRAAADPDVKGGDCYGPGKIFQMIGQPVLVKSSEASYNIEDAKNLWSKSEELTGVFYKNQ